MVERALPVANMFRALTELKDDENLDLNIGERVY